MSDVNIAIKEFQDNMDKIIRSLSDPNMTIGKLRGRMLRIIDEVSVIGDIVKFQEERLKKVEDSIKS